MKLVTALQMRECDRRTIAGENLPAPTPGRVLMERAGWGVFAALRQHFAHLGQRPILIFCGPGNNGGDGFVVARHLRALDLSPRVFLLAEPEALSPDAREQYDAYRREGGEPRVAADEAALGAALTGALRTLGAHAPLLVDALLGTGARGAPRGVIAAGVSLLNSLRDELDAEVLAVDLPTGVDADTGEVPGEAVEADVTVTMGFLKVGFLFHPARAHLGRPRVVDIGIPWTVQEDVGLPLNLMTVEEAQLLVPHRAPDAHKGLVGRILIVGGSPGLGGAPAMAGLAAVRVGAGLVTVALPAGLNPALEAKLTEVMTLPCPETEGGGLALAAEGTILARAPRTDVLALGPGLGRDPESLRLVRHLLGRFPGPVVVDADGLWALAGESWTRHAEGPPAILTPHLGEMARLCGIEPASLLARRVEIAGAYARERGCVLLLKGAPTIVADPGGEIWVSPSGNAGLATGGSGDVLTGALAGLLGQGLRPLDAARMAVFLHGHAADRVVGRTGAPNVMPTDLLAALPEALRSIEDGDVGSEAGAWISSAAYRVP
jgi:NAD(P)H-hydrate epimerase